MRKVQMRGMSAARVQRPMRTKIEQTTSAKIARSRAVRWPVSKGSGKELESEEKFSILAMPCVRRLPARAMRRKRRPKEVERAELVKRRDIMDKP